MMLHSNTVQCPMLMPVYMPEPIPNSIPIPKNTNPLYFTRHRKSHGLSVSSLGMLSNIGRLCAAAHGSVNPTKPPPPRVPKATFPPDEAMSIPPIPFPPTLGPELPPIPTTLMWLVSLDAEPGSLPLMTSSSSLLDRLDVCDILALLAELG